MAAAAGKGAAAGAGAAAALLPSPSGIQRLLEEREEEPLSLKVDSIRVGTPITVILSDNTQRASCVVDFRDGETSIRTGLVYPHCVIEVSSWTVKRTTEGKRTPWIRHFTIRHAPPRAKPPVASSASSGAASSSSSIPRAGDVKLTPLKLLTPELTRWKSRVRLTAKGQVRSYPGRNGHGGGQVTSLNIVDEEGTEMRITLFTAEIEAWYNKITVGECYDIAECKVAPANKSFNKFPHPFELTLQRFSTMEPVTAPTAIPQQKWAFVPIASLSTVAPGTFVDVLGIVRAVQEASLVTLKKKNEDLLKRVVTVADQSGVAIDVTLWGEEAQKAGEWKEGDCLAVKSSRLDQWQDQRQLVSATSIVRNPVLPERDNLVEWYAAHDGPHMVLESLSASGVGSLRGGSGSCVWKTLDCVRTESLGTEEGKPDDFRATVLLTRFLHDADRPPWYLACGADEECATAHVRKNCLKKAVENADSETGWDPCPFCRRSFTNPTPRYFATVQMADSTGVQIVSASHQWTELLLGVKVEVLVAYLRNKNTAAFAKAMDAALYRMWTCKLRAKLEVGDKQRTKVDLLGVSPVSYAVETRRLLSALLSSSCSSST